MKFVVEIVTQGVDYPRFRRAYHSEEFNQQVAKEANVERTLQEFVTLPDGKERRRVLVVPRIAALPGAFQTLLNGSPVRYEEITVFNPATRTASFAVESPAGDKLNVTGEARFLDADGGVRLRFEGHVEVRLFGLGTLVERFVVREVTARYALIERLLQKFVDERRGSDDQGDHAHQADPPTDSATEAAAYSAALAAAGTRAT
jgi:hypothetical protein